MKYGLFRYGLIEREGYWVDDINIGDYIQSIAARQFLPQVDTLIERDSIADYQGDRIRVIMNGWWHLYKGNAVPSKQIDPLYVSMHINKPQDVPPEAIEYLKQHGPIGCRDYSTTNFLKERGVDAYFSGCMTLTLGKTYAVPPEERTNNIYYVNFDPNVLVNYVKSKMFGSVGFTPPKVRRRLHSIINMFFPDYAKCRHIYRDHSVSLPPSEKERFRAKCLRIYRSRSVPLPQSEDDLFRIADQYLRDYARAKLVITTKIHCALPCAGMGTPVILMMTNPQDPRFGGIKELLNHMGVDTSGEIIQHLFMPPGTSGYSLGNSPEIPAIVDALSEKCRNFVSAPW